MDTERFRPGAGRGLRERLAEPGEKILLHASNFRPVKRTLDVVRVFAMVQARMPARLVLVGDGPELPRTAELAGALGLREKVIFAGQQATVEHLLAAADLFLLPSEFESFGLSALEALACGVPVIATNAGGLPEVITEGVTGHRCRVGDVERMAGLAAELLGDPERHRAVREAARREVVEKFSEEAVVDLYEGLYTEVLGA